ncbi:putative bifunctional diguanylate cyclase/phosphodiesterase [Jiella avicenniae]|uniref:Bifunctional diguanylate cyclase/phosphodiesterase n=1 Tax=Jiella avicenniae TaxID=2907202 RepID=A0A9X1P4B7_9HYPH|nr:bifunctional diguanylate cyclase/phosphodiesterase [Jiella avicenniae]MCE7029013.1 bifunctional diguanylate cyclase/phosphodiesterase [Jiella avicenniae]
MISLLTKRLFWTSILGAAAIFAVVAGSVLAIGHEAVGRLVEAEMRSRGQNFADLLLGPQRYADAMLTGIARDPEAENFVRRVADLSSIDGYALFDRNGEEVFRSRSERYEWLLRDRPGGVSTGDKLSASTVSRPGAWQVVSDAGQTNPSVIMPLIRDGRTIGFLSVVSDMIAERYHYQSTLARTYALVIVVVLAATIVPFVLFHRRRRRIAEADERIRFLADHDSLTQLLNRRRMQEACDQLLFKIRATREEIAYLYVDLDDLAEINDRCGQARGDEILRIVARRLAASLDEEDLVARIGPDDFAIVRRRVSDRRLVGELAQKLSEAVGEPVEIDGHQIVPKISIGCAFAPEHGRSHSELVKHAEIAHFHHKADRQGPLVFFEPQMDEVMHRRRHVEAHIKRAVENDGFELFYQPLVRGHDGSLVGFEALVRLRDEKGTLIPPSEFVPIAEARGYVKAMGSWVIREATRQIAQWPAPLFVSVNLSAVQFVDGDLVAIIRSALDAAGIEGERLEVEVVESLMLERSTAILDQLFALKQLGISIDMDDFGTGYSSLGYLWRFPFDKLKVDQSFMKALENGEPNVKEIVRTIVSLAHQMKMKVTTEGVETEEQARFLASLGCDQLQGYFFGKPLPAGEIAENFLVGYRRNDRFGEGARSAAAIRRIA